MARPMKFPRSRAGRAAPAGQAGFTLLELLVTLAIAGLLLAIAAPRMAEAVARARVDVTARQIVTILRETRAAALEQARPIMFSIDGAGHGFAVAGKSFVVPAGQSLAYQPFAGPAAAPALGFLADGSSTGGAIIVSGGGTRSRVAVDWLTGRVSMRD